MAKQNNRNTNLPPSGSDVVSSAAAVSAVQGRFIGGGKKFADSFGAALKYKKTMETRAAKNRDAANALMQGFDSYVDVAEFNANEQKAVKAAAMEYRNQFADLANQAARIQDKTSAEYALITDKMQDIKNSMQTLRGNLESYAKYKIQFAEELDAYSKAGENDKAIYQGKTMIANGFSSINADGSLHFDATSETIDTGETRAVPAGFDEFGPVGEKLEPIMETVEYEGFDYSSKSYTPPFKPADEAFTAIKNQIGISRQSKGEIDQAQRDMLQNEIRKIISKPNVFASLVASQDFQGIINFDDLIATNPDGTLNQEDLEEASLRIANAIVEQRGADLVKEESSETSDPVEYTNTYIVNNFKNKQPMIVLPDSTRHAWLAVDKNGERLKPNNNGIVDKNKIAGYREHRYSDEDGWMLVPNQSMVMINDVNGFRSANAQFIKKK